MTTLVALDSAWDGLHLIVIVYGWQKHHLACVKSSGDYSTMVLTLMRDLRGFGQAHRILRALGIDAAIMNFIGCSIRLLVLAGCGWIVAGVGRDPTVHSCTRLTDREWSLPQRRLRGTFKRPPQSLVPRVSRLHLQTLLLERRCHSHSR